MESLTLNAGMIRSLIDKNTKELAEHREIQRMHRLLVADSEGKISEKYKKDISSCLNVRVNIFDNFYGTFLSDSDGTLMHFTGEVVVSKETDRTFVSFAVKSFFVDSTEYIGPNLKMRCRKNKKTPTYAQFVVLSDFLCVFLPSEQVRKLTEEINSEEVDPEEFHPDEIQMKEAEIATNYWNKI